MELPSQFAKGGIRRDDLVDSTPDPLGAVVASSRSPEITQFPPETVKRRGPTAVRKLPEDVVESNGNAMSNGKEGQSYFFSANRRLSWMA